MAAFSSRYALSKSERRRLVERLRATLPAAAELVEKAGRVELARLREPEKDLLIIDGVPALVMGEEVYPTVLAAHRLSLKLPLVVVDMGAVPHILNGADVMAPGIVEAEPFSAGDLVYVADVEKRRVFAVGRALMSSDEIARVRRGRAVKNLHYAGDKVWRALTG
ncbi:MAG: DUF1947 domain-containing protein [Thermofilaceae archaeon]